MESSVPERVTIPEQIVKLHQAGSGTQGIAVFTSAHVQDYGILKRFGLLTNSSLGCCSSNSPREVYRL